MSWLIAILFFVAGHCAPASRGSRGNDCAEADGRRFHLSLGPTAPGNPPRFDHPTRNEVHVGILLYFLKIKDYKEPPDVLQDGEARLNTEKEQPGQKVRQHSGSRQEVSIKSPRVSGSMKLQGGIFRIILFDIYLN